MNIKSALKKDNVFIDAKMVSTTEITGLQTISSKSNLIIAENTIVNVVSDNYGFLKNENYFLPIEEKLINAGVDYVTQSTNRANRVFKVDYILTESQETAIGTPKDTILPMMTFTNSYDGSHKSIGTFALYRKICTNGLHIAEHQIGFSIKHNLNIESIVLPEIDKLIKHFMDTEYFQLVENSKKLYDRKLSSVSEWVNKICDETKLFDFHSDIEGEKVSKKAIEVIDIILSECEILNDTPNEWVGYNAFNNIIHQKNGNFQKLGEKDRNLFSHILSN